jgi:peptidyl-prolyl cis-trans isomerase C
MKSFVISILIIALQGMPQATMADNSESEQDILAKRGKGVVSQNEFTARASQIPDKHRLVVLRDRNRVRDMLNNMLLKSQLAADAREAGFEKDPLVIDRMKLVAENELAAAWLQHYIASQPEADYEALAFDYYQLNKSEILSTPRVDVTHLLVSNTERSDEETLVLAQTLYEQILENPSSFEELILKHSDDPSVSSNNGSFGGAKRGDMVKPFEDMAFSLEPGEISEPVKTQYGYHIIRLNTYHAPVVLPFERVKKQLIERQREEHDSRIEADYRDRLTSFDVDMTQENLEEMIRRQFGEDYVDPYTNNEKVE